MPLLIAVLIFQRRIVACRLTAGGGSSALPALDPQFWRSRNGRLRQNRLYGLRTAQLT